MDTKSLATPEDKMKALQLLQGSCCGNIADTLRHIADTVMPLIAASSNTGEGTPINPNPDNNPPI